MILGDAMTDDSTCPISETCPPDYGSRDGFHVLYEDGGGKFTCDCCDQTCCCRVDEHFLIPLKIEPGATYAIEVNQLLTPEEAAEIRAKIYELTQANFVILGPGVRLTDITHEDGFI